MKNEWIHTNRPAISSLADGNMLIAQQSTLDKLVCRLFPRSVSNDHGVLTTPASKPRI